MSQPSIAMLPAQVGVNDLAATLAAMANGRGGTLLLTLMAGEESIDDAVERVREAALLVHPMLILPQPRAVDATQIAVTVPGDMSRVFALDGRYLRRDGDANRPLSPRELRQLLIERGELSFEEEPVRGAAITDLDWREVEAYAAKIGTLRETPRDLLLRRGCLVKPDTTLIPTHAGLLLFGKDPQRFIRSARITGVRFAGVQMSDMFTRNDLSGTLPKQIRAAETFLHDHLRRIVRLTGSMEREEAFEYPMEAARELIINAVSHRDYSISGDDIRLFLFADRLEVTNPGKLAGQVTLDNIVDERYSRNPIIVQVLSDLGFIERLGYGVDRIINLMAANGLPAPEFSETAGGFRARLYNVLGSKGGESGREVIASVSDAPDVLLNPRQEVALQFLRQVGHVRITNGDLQAMFPSIHPETIRRDLADLVQKGLLLKRGAKRGSYYVLNGAFDK
jgi:ATP-dependent DNA helicase RecG